MWKPRRKTELGLPAAARPARGDSRRGFTMIELMVVVVIVIVLSVITISAVNFAFDSERIRSGARQIQSYLEGARDRAIFAKEPRGVRFLIDETNPRASASMVYIGPNAPWQQGTIRMERADDLPAGMPDGMADSAAILRVRGSVHEDVNGNGVLDMGEDFNGNGTLDEGTDWVNLASRGLLTPGARIKIPGDDNGAWYTILFPPTPPNPPPGGGSWPVPLAQELLGLASPYREAGTTPVGTVAAFTAGTGPTTYLLDLPPSVLPNQKPTLLPRNIVVDLDRSVLPSGWLIPVYNPTTMMTTLRYSSRMDVMFSPRGTVTGSAASRGLIHFVLAETRDAEAIVSDVMMTPDPSPGLPLEAVRWMPSTDYAYGDTVQPAIPDGLYFKCGVAGMSGSTEPVLFTTGQNGQFVMGDGGAQWVAIEKHDNTVVTVFTRTGNISSHPVFRGLPLDPFLYSETGEVAK